MGKQRRGCKDGLDGPGTFPAPGPPLDKDNQVPQAITGWTFCPGLILPTCLLCISHPISNAFFHSAS